MYANCRSSELGGQKLAKIQFATGGLPRDCMIPDMSAGGVKTTAEHPEIPPEFTAIFSEGRRRQRRLAWRIGCELGAQFSIRPIGRIDPARPGRSAGADRRAGGKDD